MAMDEFKKYYDLDIEYASKEDLLEKADELVITTAWDEFKDIKQLTDKQIVDCRYML